MDSNDRERGNPIFGFPIKGKYETFLGRKEPRTHSLMIKNNVRFYVQVCEPFGALLKRFTLMT